jgi:hypothetical protein
VTWNSAITARRIAAATLHPLALTSTGRTTARAHITRGLIAASLASLLALTSCGLGDAKDAYLKEHGRPIPGTTTGSSSPSVPTASQPLTEQQLQELLVLAYAANEDGGQPAVLALLEQVRGISGCGYGIFQEYQGLALDSAKVRQGATRYMHRTYQPTAVVIDEIRPGTWWGVVEMCACKDLGDAER